MAEKLLKGTLLVALMLVMAIGAPAMTRAEVGANAGSSDPGSIISDVGDLNSAMGALPGLFGGMGGAGQVLGQIMSLLVDQFMELSARELIPGYYVLNATVEKTWNTTIAKGTQVRYFYPDYGYVNASRGDLDTKYGENSYSYPYCVVNRTVGDGGINVTKTTGMSITIGIWDADGTLVKAIDRVMKTVQKFMNMKGTDAGYKAALEDAASSVMYLIIHINDIITGDELIIYNPITYEYMTTNGTFSEAHQWRIDTWPSGYRQVNDMEIDVPLILDAWNATAQSNKNGFMTWLLSPGIAGTYNVTWGSFSFDLMQLWLKRFYVSIDVQELVNMINSRTGNVNPAKILKDLDIDFYLLWHHLMGGAFYNDVNDNSKIDVNYQNVTYANGTVVTTPDGTIVQRPNSTEVTHLIGMKRMDSVTWNHPTANTDKTSVSWGVKFNGIDIFWTPVGMNAEDQVRNKPSAKATMDFLELGFTFEPGAIIQLNNTDGTPSDKQGRDAKVKLNQHFGRWNDIPSIIDPDLAGLDFAMLYLSTLVHVHFTAQLLEKISKGTGDWNEGNKQATVNSTKVEENHELVFGSEAGMKSPMVGRVDIAGPGYDIYEYAVPSTTYERMPASTQIIPLALFTMDAQATGSYEDSSGGFDAAAYLGIEFAVMLYSVNYPEFSTAKYNGGKIWHDPTFSIFMTFEAGTYWAIFLLVGVVALVGIAAVLITRSKNNR